MEGQGCQFLSKPRNVPLNETYIFLVCKNTTNILMTSLCHARRSLKLQRRRQSIGVDVIFKKKQVAISIKTFFYVSGIKH